jgi:hypothetical protein
LATLQTGWVALHCESAWHATHWPVIELQMGASGGQSVAAWQPTQAPVAVSQRGAPGRQPAFDVHLGAHELLAGSHAWPTAQSDEVRQVTHAPSTQKGALKLQSLSAPHWAQPTPTTHACAQG